jgi:hypothetical protein
VIFDELFFPLFSGWDLWYFVICGTVRGIGLLGETLSTTLRVVGRPPFGSKPLTCRIHVAPSAQMRAGCMHHYSLTLKVVAHSAHSRFLMVFVLTFFGNILIHGYSCWISALDKGAGAPIVQLSCHYSGGLKNREDRKGHKNRTHISWKRSSLSWNPDSELILNSFNVMFFFCVFVYFVRVRSFKAH